MKHSLTGVTLRLFKSVSARRRSVPVDPGGTPHFNTDQSFLASHSVGRTRPQIQSGALAWRRVGSGIEILLVRKLRSGNWGIPKGKVKPGLSSAENAAKEAFEEAGIKGDVEDRVICTYRAVKRQRDQKILIEVSVHLLEVTETAADWDEKHKREIKWCFPQEAAKLLNEPSLIELCKVLGD